MESLRAIIGFVVGVELYSTFRKVFSFLLFHRRVGELPRGKRFLVGILSFVYGYCGGVWPEMLHGFLTYDHEFFTVCFVLSRPSCWP